MGKAPNILTIAGADSGGGAGIQADLKTIAALGGFGLSAITALTAQNGLGVDAIHAPPADFAAQQLQTLLDGFPVAAGKTGMLFSADIINALADILDNTKFPLVVDPVCVSQSGHKLLEDAAVGALKARMLPRATLLTPNVPEAELLAGLCIRNEEDAKKAIAALLEMGAGAVLLKGGHMDARPEDAEIFDLLGLPGVAPIAPIALSQPRVDTVHTHGTGCTLSAAIAVGLGHGAPLEEAVRRAQTYLNACLRAGYAPGRGFGPPNHMAPLYAAQSS